VQASVRAAAVRSFQGIYNSVREGRRAPGFSCY
jgi:hypothetical protein